MTTSAYQQSDYKSNIDQTDRHLHVTSGSKELEVKEQSLNNFQIKVLIEELLIEQKKTNMYLSEMIGNKIKNIEVM
jgi:hypothetical protein